MKNECFDRQARCTDCVVKLLGENAMEAGMVVDESIKIGRAFRDGVDATASATEVERQAHNGAMAFKRPELTGIVAGAMVLVVTGKCER